MSVKTEIRGYRFFSREDVTLDWGESRTFDTNIGDVKVQLVTAKDPHYTNSCGGLLVLLSLRRRMSAYFCDFTGKFVAVGDMLQFLQHIRVEGAFDRVSLN